jgi:uncharacterized membrane protein
VHLDMTIEEGIKLVISGGIVAPKSQLDVLADAAKGMTPSTPDEEGDSARPDSEPAPEPTRIAAR